MKGSYVAFETDRFRNDQPDDEIDQWFLGEDVARWLHDGLVQCENVTSTCTPLEEDWGWTFGVRLARTRFWVNIWNMHTWIVGLEVRSGLLCVFHTDQTTTAELSLRQKVSEMLKGPEFKNVAWYDEWPSERCG